MRAVLVTGGSGYIATQLIAALARSGQPVRATARSVGRENAIRAALARGGVAEAELEVVVADLNSDDGWAAAMDGVEEVHHVASPIPVTQPENPDDLIAPARDGTLRVLRAARDTGVRRVVLTSSFAAIGYSPKPVRDYDESDWTDPDTPGLAAYPRSKAVAERAAWDFMSAEGGDTELVVINPTFVLGPSLSTELRSSLALTKMMIEGTMSVVPRQRFGVADVRDVVDMHIAAMATPEAAGRRYLVLADGATISFLEMAQILREHLGARGERVPTAEAEGPELVPLIIHNDRAKAELGLTPRPVQSTIVETAESLAQLGLLDLSVRFFRSGPLPIGPEPWGVSGREDHAPSSPSPTAH